MTNVFGKFVSESTGLHKDTLTEQIRMSEDVNKYSVWLLGLSTAGVALLVIRFQAILDSSWVQPNCAKIGVITTGLLFLASVLSGALHQTHSIKQRNCYRVLIAMFGNQNLIPYFNHPDYPKDEVPEDMHRKISDGELLNHGNIPKFKSTKKQAKELSCKLSVILFIQQVFTGTGYLLLFAFSIPA